MEGANALPQKWHICNSTELEVIHRENVYYNMCRPQNCAYARTFSNTKVYLMTKNGGDYVPQKIISKTPR